MASDIQPEPAASPPAGAQAATVSEPHVQQTPAASVSSLEANKPASNRGWIVTVTILALLGGIPLTFWAFRLRTTPDKWPLFVVSIAMVVSALIDGMKLKVPNRLTFPIIISGWLLGAAYDLNLLSAPILSPPFSPTWCPHWVASIFVMMVGFALLYPLNYVHMMGGGDVKMQMGFAAWIGACYGMYSGIEVFWWGYAFGVLAGGFIGMAIMLFDGRLKQHSENAREILADFATAGSIAKIKENAARRKSKLTKLPYGVPLSIGYIAYLVYLNW